MTADSINVPAPAFNPAAQRFFTRLLALVARAVRSPAWGTLTRAAGTGCMLLVKEGAVDSDRFDGLSRFMALREARDSRRRVMAAFLGVAAMLPAPLLTVARKKKTRKGCKRKAIKICTGFVCGRRKNNCGKTLKCQCLAGLICLPNGGCGLPCATGCPGNGTPCTCPTNGEGICLVGDVACAALTTLCQTTADCPEQAACGEVPCGPGGASEKRCVPLCRG